MSSILLCDIVVIVVYCCVTDHRVRVVVQKCWLAAGVSDERKHLLINNGCKADNEVNYIQSQRKVGPKYTTIKLQSIEIEILGYFVWKGWN